MKKDIGIFFGSDTGNTESIANIIQYSIGSDIADIFDIAKSNKEIINKYDKLIFGIPTWYYGEPQCDWEDFFPTLKEIDFSKKYVSIFGCGDQEDYSEYFCDAMGQIYNIVKSKNANLIGKWPVSGYNFKVSQGLIDKEHFVGLALDEDRQPELTKERIKTWINQIAIAMKI